MKKTILICLLLVAAIFAGCAEKNEPSKPAMQPGQELAAKQIEAESISISSETADVESTIADVEDFQLSEDSLSV